MKKVSIFRFGDLSMIASNEDGQTKVSVFWCDEHKEDMFFMNGNVNECIDMAHELLYLTEPSNDSNWMLN